MEITIISYILKLNVLECLNARKLRRETSGLCPPKAEARGSKPFGCARSLSWIVERNPADAAGSGRIIFLACEENEGFIRHGAPAAAV
jgi:hypothetical protein